MKRLFYKVFGIFCVVILCSVTFTSISFWLVQNNITDVQRLEDSHRKSELLGNALAIFWLEGEKGLVSWLDSWQQNKKNTYIVYVIDDQGRELLERKVDSNLLKAAQEKASSQTPSPSARIVNNELGEEYLFFVVNTQKSEPPPLEAQKRWISTIAFIFSGLAMAYYLARYLEKPISVLHNGFERLASGQLDTRIKKNMGRRKDELSLLGNDFDHMAEKLQSLVESQQHLLHHVSHEIRSPIARLQAIVALAHQQPDQKEKNLARIEEELIRMESLVSELLTLARLESKTADIPQEEINLNKMLEQLIEDCQELILQNQQHLTLNLAEDIDILGNEALLYRAFDNIIRNACLYSGDGSQIDIKLYRPDKKHIQLTVSDNGKGIKETELAFLFEPFYRGSSNQHIKGTGLGLAITRQIIERHNGKIIARNIIPHGFEMEMTFESEAK